MKDKEGETGPFLGRASVTRGRVNREGEGGWMRLKYFINVYKNWTMKPVEIVLIMEKGGEGEW
jgi:hypothetical protein